MSRPRRLSTLCIAGLLALTFAAPAAGERAADTATIAVASNFAVTARALAEAFEQETPYRLRLAIGSTGKLFGQITLGAPFDAFLAADQARPARLVAAGRAVAGSQFTYATGAVVLWDPDGGDVSAARLRDGDFRRLAIAEPKLAPYGQAAWETLESLDLASELSDRLVYGENIGQTFAFVATGNAELGFVAAAQIAALPAAGRGTVWRPPPGSHAPVRQDAVLLNQDSAAARAFLEYLASDAARRLLTSHGYETS